MLKVCKECGRTFETNNKAYVYCSDECRNAGRNKRANEWWHKKHPGSVKYSDDPYEVKTCVCCGKEFKPIRYNQVVCSDECRRQHRNKLQNARYEGNTWEEWVEKQRKAGAEKREKSKAEKKAKREKEKAERMREGVCIVCGNTFHTLNPSQITCSSKCSRRWRYHKQDSRIKGKIVDSDITLEALYNRDSGVCYLCGCKCNWEDKEITQDGYQITGPTYPTIEHIVPLSLGGMHSWNNVKLACFECNSKKGATIPEGYEQNVQELPKLSKKRGKTVSQYTKGGVLIDTFASTAEAERKTGIRQSGIQNCARGESKSCGGFVWKYGGVGP